MRECEGQLTIRPCLPGVHGSHLLRPRQPAVVHPVAVTVKHQDHQRDGQRDTEHDAQYRPQWWRSRRARARQTPDQGEQNHDGGRGGEIARRQTVLVWLADLAPLSEPALSPPLSPRRLALTSPPVP